MQTEILKVNGMTCGGCVGKVTQALKEVDGVTEVNVSLDAGEATVKFDEHLTSLQNLKSSVEHVGYNTDTSPKNQGKGGCCG